MLCTYLPYRPKWEGGQYEGDEKKRQEALILAMELGADYIDVELKVGMPCIFGFTNLLVFIFYQY